MTSVPETWHIHGHIIIPEDIGFALVKIQAYDVCANDEYYLGENGFDEEYNFSITYSRAQFQRGDSGRLAPAVVFKLIDEENNVVWISRIHTDVTPEYTCNIDLNTDPPQAWKISGNVNHNGASVTSGRVVISDVYDFSKWFLAESPLDNQGNYTITYYKDQFYRGGFVRPAPRIVFQVYDNDNNCIGEIENPVSPTPSFTYPINIIDDQATHYVHGTVHNPSGHTICGLKVVAMHVARTPQGFEEVSLGEAVTHSAGGYTIAYDPSNIPGYSPGELHLEIMVFDRQDNPLLEQPIIKTDAEDQQKIAIEVSVPSNTDSSEFSLAQDMLVKAGFNKAQIKAMYTRPELIELAHKDSGVPKEIIKAMARAFGVMGELKEELGDSSDLLDEMHTEFLYPITRTRLACDLHTLRTVDAKKFRTTLTAAFVRNLIPPQLERHITPVVNEWRKIYTSLLTDKSHVKNIIGSLIVDEDLQEGIKRVYAKFAHNMNEFWAEIEKIDTFGQKEFSREEKDRLRFGFDVYEFADRFLPLAESIFTNCPETYRHLYELVAFESDDWTNIINEVTLEDDRPWSWVDHVPGETDEEKKKNYARLLKKNIENKFPMVTLKRDIGDQDVDAYWDDVKIFLNHNPLFDFAEDEISPNMSGVVDIEKLRCVQRMYRIRPKFKTMEALRIHEYTSAFAITRTDRDEFVAAMANDIDGEEDAHVAYSAAVHVASQALYIMGSYNNPLDRESVPALSHHKPVQTLSAETLKAETLSEESTTRVFPDIVTLFGNQNQIACEHCQSVFSASAYLVDILQFLREDIRNKLLYRRADLAEIDLTCTNTNGLVSYIDLVNELLEEGACTRRFYVQNALELFRTYLNEWPQSAQNEDEESGIPDIVMAEFNNRGYPLAESFVVHKVKDYWYITCDAWRYKISECIDEPKTTLAFEIIPYPQTGKDSQLRTTKPEHVHQVVYNLLKIPVYPFNLPFDLVHESVHRLMDMRSTEWYQLVSFFEGDLGPGSFTDQTVVRTFLRLSEEQKDLIENEDPLESHRLWGFDENDEIQLPGMDQPISGSWHELLRNAAVFLNRSKLTLNQLLDLLSTVTVNVDKRIYLDSDYEEAKQEADLTRYEIKDATEADFVLIARFLRLWRHCGIDMFTLDRILAGILEYGDRRKRQKVMPSSLTDLSVILRVAKDFDADPLRVISWYRNIDFVNLGRGPKCLLEKLFIDTISNPERAEYWRGMINDISFRGDIKIGEIDDEDTPLEDQGGDIPTFIAGCGVSWEDLQTIIMNTFGGGGGDPRLVLEAQPLSVNTISKLFRVADFARTLGISISDYYTIKTLINVREAGQDSLEFPEFQYAFRDAADALDTMGLKPIEADYILRGMNESAISWAPQEKEAVTVIGELQSEVAQAKTTVPPDDITPRQHIERALMTHLADKLKISATLTETLLSEVLDAVSNTYSGQKALNEYLAAALGGWRVEFFTERNFTDKIDYTVDTVPHINVVAGSKNATEMIPKNALSAQWTTFLFSPSDIGKTLSAITGCIEDKSPGTLELFITGSWRGVSVDHDFEADTLYKVEVKWIAEEDPATRAENETINLRTEWKDRDAGGSKTTLIGPAQSTPTEEIVYTRLKKVARLVDAFGLDDEALVYLTDAEHVARLELFDFNAIPRFYYNTNIPWSKFFNYAQICMLRKRLTFAEDDIDLINFWRWAELDRYDEPAYQKKIAEQTGWSPHTISVVAEKCGFSYPDDYCHPQSWHLLERAHALFTDLGISASLGWELHEGRATFSQLESVRNAIRSHYGAQQWAEIAGPVQDTLRGLTRDALLAYMGIRRRNLEYTQDENGNPTTTGPEVLDLSYKLHYQLGIPEVGDIFTRNMEESIQLLQQLNGYNITGSVGPEVENGQNTWLLLDTRESFLDSNAIYAWFLIDPHMQPCMKTSRIVQALSSVQLFIQRILLNFEQNIEAREKFRQQWSWMKNYRVWEANRKIFLYPENWLEPELRDDKTPLFEDVETALLQNELNPDTIEDAFKTYVKKMEEYANLEIVGSYEEFNNGQKILHIIGRTHQMPHVFYYRRFHQVIGGEDYWSSWEKVELDITSEAVIPVIFRHKLYLFWPIVEEKEKEIENPDYNPNDKNKPKYKECKKYLELKLAWSEYTNGSWSEKHVTRDAYCDLSSGIQAPNIKPEDFFHLKADRSSNQVIVHAYGIYMKRINEPKEEDVEKLKKLLPFFFRHYTPAFQKILARWLIPEYQRVIKRVAQFTFSLNNACELNAISVKEEYNLEKSLPENTVLRHNTAYQTDSAEDSADFDTLAYPENNVLFEKTPEMYSCFPTNLTFIDRTARPIFYQENDNTYMMRTYRRKTERNLIGVDEEESSKEYWYQKVDLISHPHAHEFVERVLYRGIDDLLTRDTQALWDGSSGYQGGYLGYHIAGDKLAWHNSQVAFHFKYFPTDLIKEPYPVPDVDFRNEGAYGVYNWELFFHLPLLMATRLMQDQRYDDAMRWFHFIFNPSLDFNMFEKTQRWAWELPPGARYWAFLPFFANRDARESLNSILTRDKGSEEDTKLGRMIEDWKDEPFKPHLVARHRTVAYQKAVVMRYLDNILQWADSLFRQDTMESINEATQLYVYASEILGERPTIIEQKQERPPMSYTELSIEGLNSFSNTMIDLENMIPPAPPSKMSLWKNKKVVSPYYYYYYYGSQSSPDSIPRSSEPLLRMATVCSYFCIPRNIRLLKYWDTVEDRLFKIRNCMNIEGEKRSLALFAPPIDPGMLARAAAAGVNIGDVIKDMSTPLPPYRFTALLQKAIDFCQEVKSFGAQILSAAEKKDAEELSLLRNEHEIEMNKLLEDNKKAQIEEAVKSLKGLRIAQTSAEERYNYYNTIEKYIPMEVAQLTLMTASGVLHTIGQVMMSGGAAIKSVPDFFVGALIGFAGGPMTNVKAGGGDKQGGAMEGLGRAFTVQADILNRAASITGTMASYERRWKDWKLQEALALKEIDRTKLQIDAAEIRQQIAEYDLRNHQKQLEQIKSVKEVMTTKFSNKNLYAWTVEQLNITYNTMYDLAYQMAKKAEKAYQIELGDDSVSFIKPGCWNSAKKGLLAGEKLMGALRRMDAAYMENNRRELEITKTVSLKMLDPMALLKLRETGECGIDIPELLFDFDFPGHYFRRIKSVRLTIPCITGPYTNVNASLSLGKNTIRINDLLTPDGEYENQNADDGSDDRFREGTVAIGKIATSSAQMDAGMFDFNFRDERYLPFEGAGAVSSWTLTLAKEFRQFDYNTISDVIMHISYTAREAKQKKFVEKVEANIASKLEMFTFLPRIFSFRQEYAQAYQDIAQGDQGTITIHERDLSHIIVDRARRRGSTLSLEMDSFLVYTKEDITGTVGVTIEGVELTATVSPQNPRLLKFSSDTMPEISLDDEISISSLQKSDGTIIKDSIEDMYLIVASSVADS